MSAKRKFESGAQKRIRKKKQQFIEKLPKMTQFCQALTSSASTVEDCTLKTGEELSTCDAAEMSQKVGDIERDSCPDSETHIPNTDPALWKFYAGKFKISHH